MSVDSVVLILCGIHFTEATDYFCLGNSDVDLSVSYTHLTLPTILRV